VPFRAFGMRRDAVICVRSATGWQSRPIRQLSEKLASGLERPILAELSLSSGRQDATHRSRKQLTKAVALLTRAVFDRTLGIHPTVAEEFVTTRDVPRIA
jgi:hypothetical protein